MEGAILIKEKRKKLGITQKELADSLGLGKHGDRTIRRWENGETMPSKLELNAVLEFANHAPFKNNRVDNLFTFADLFAGIGGIRIPFQELGGKCVFTSEWDAFSQKTYRINFDENPEGNIKEINSVDIAEFDILLAGFPCQPFSQAGLKKGFSDTRGTLFFDIERIIQDKRPKAVLLENVKQLAGHDKGRTLATIIKHLQELDYFVDYKVLRAADFGIPQNRERIYIVALDNTAIQELPIDYKFPFPKPLLIPTRLGDILEQKVDEKYTISDTLWKGHQRRKQEHLKKGNGFGYSLFNSNSVYVSTLSARYYKDGSEILIDQGKNVNPRRLTPRECARLQGFSDDYIIPVSDTQAYRQFGNSVAVPVVRAVAESIINELQRFNVIG